MTHGFHWYRALAGSQVRVHIIGPALPWTAAATKAALIDIRAEMREMRSEFRSELRNEIGGLRKEIGDMRAEMHAEIRGLRADYRWLMGLMLAAAGGILAVMAHGFHWF